MQTLAGKASQDKRVGSWGSIPENSICFNTKYNPDLFDFY